VHAQATLFCAVHAQATLFCAVHAQATLFCAVQAQTTLFCAVHAQKLRFFAHGLRPITSLHKIKRLQAIVLFFEAQWHGSCLLEHYTLKINLEQERVYD